MNDRITKFRSWSEFQRADDEAWMNDGKCDNRSLKDGDHVKTIHQTTCDFFNFPAGVVGVVAHAKTPRVRKTKGTKSNYFANVDVEYNGKLLRIRVPHSALKKIKP